MRGPLFNLYMTIRNRPGWMADCFAAGFSKEEMDYLEQCAVAFHDYRPEQDADDWTRQVEKEGGIQVWGAENDDEKIKLLSGVIAEIYQDYERSIWADEPYADRKVMLMARGVERLEKLRRSIRGRQLHKAEMERAAADPTYDATAVDRVTDADIEAARSYPLERLIPDFDMFKAGRILCRWHEDKRPSMLVKNGFGYCFACAKSIDSIGWLVEIEHMGFLDAVKYLRGKGV